LFKKWFYLQSLQYSLFNQVSELQTALDKKDSLLLDAINSALNKDSEIERLKSHVIFTD
jgi:hypothetical protein